MCLSLGGFPLAWVKYACEWMLLTTVAEKSWMAGPRKRFIYFFECVCIAGGGGGAPQLPFPRLPGNVYVGKSRAYGHPYFLRLKSTQAGTLLLRPHQWLGFHHEIYS